MYMYMYMYTFVCGWNDSHETCGNAASFPIHFKLKYLKQIENSILKLRFLFTTLNVPYAIAVRHLVVSYVIAAFFPGLGAQSPSETLVELYHAMRCSDHQDQNMNLQNC
jgi:hypothetical protein